MKIGIDVRSLEDGAQHRGIGRYATDLIQALSIIDKENDYYFLLSSPSAKPPQLTLDKGFSASYLHGKKPWIRNLKYIRIFFLLPKPIYVDRFHLDVVLQVDPGERIRGRKTPIVSLAHDFIPFIYKDWYQHVHLGGYSPGYIIGYARLRLRWKALEHELTMYKKRAKVIAISKHTKKDLLTQVRGVRSSDVEIILLGANQQIGSASKTVPKNLEQLTYEQFLFYVGGADPRKGLVSLVRSLENLWLTYPSLHIVMAGKEITHPDVPEAAILRNAVDSLSRKEQVHLLGFISDEELAWLYANATAFVFPSRYEGFGLPVLEAMQAGCPVIAYRNSSIPEVAGDAAILVEDGKSMVPAIEKLVANPKLRANLVKKGKAQAAKFSWEKTAKETLLALSKAGKI